MSDLLPHGVHPRDASIPIADALDQHNAPVPADQGGPRYETSPRQWGTPNSRAVGTFQRLSDTMAVGTMIVDTNQGGTIKIIGRRPGRTRLTLWVPSSYFPGGVLTTTPAGVLFSEDEGELQQSWVGGAALFVGDSADISSEAAVWAGLQPGQALGVVSWIHCWDSGSGPVDY